MVKSFRGHTRAQELYENTLFTTPQDKTALVADPSRVAHAFLLNFFGTLGMINATKPAQKRALLTFLKTDKKLRIDTIDDTNLDISLSLKLASEADFFTQTTTVAEITRFLVKLKTGQIDHIDSAVVGKWAVGMRPAFLMYIKDPAARRIFNQFRMDEGKTIDVSSLAVVLKTRVNKMSDGGDFQRFAKRFIGLTAISPSATTPVAAAPTAQPAAAPAPTAPVKLNYYQRQKLKKQQAAAGTTPASTTPAAAPAPKLSYYQKQKLKKDAAKADVAKIAADAKAAEIAALQAKWAAEDLKKKEEEENRKAAAAAVKTMPREDFDKLIDSSTESGNIDPSRLTLPHYVQRLFKDKFTVLPDLYVQTASALGTAVGQVREAMTDKNADFDIAIKSFDTAMKEVQKISGYSINVPQYIMRSLGNHSGAYLARLLYMAVRADGEMDDVLLNRALNNGSMGFIEYFLPLFSYGDPNLAKLAKIMARNPTYLNRMTDPSMPIERIFTALGKSYSGGGMDFQYSGSSHISHFAVMVMQAASPGINYYIERITADNYKTNFAGYTASNFFLAYGTTKPPSIENIDPADAKYIQGYITYFLENEFKTGFDNVKRSILRNMPSGMDYDASYPLLKSLRDMYADDLIKNGYDKSALFNVLKAPIGEFYVKHIIKAIGIDIADLLKAHPNDPSTLYLSAVQNGLNSITPIQLASIINTPSNIIRSATSMWNIGRNIVNNALGDRDQNSSAIAKAMLEIAKTRPAEFKDSTTGEELMRYLPNADKDTVVAWVKFAKENNNKWIMGSDLYKYIHKSKKQGYVDILTGIVQDSIGTEVEDYVNDIMESLAPHVIQKMRGNLVGANVLIQEMNKSPIKPFDTIDSTRMKKILTYNDLNLNSIVSGVIDKKKKSETYAQYFDRSAKAVSGKQLLAPTKVTEVNSMAAAKAANRIMIQRDHAGKHGDVYPKIDKVFDANLEYPEFWEFRKKKPMDGSVTPAYHGTGGIGAGMVLRYGFKIIKASDPSVTGRMLGDGIYISNKIDKVTQYVSNNGYSRRHGQQGYLFEMDTNLGTKNVDYRVAGLGNDSIRSPEWCLVDPKAQIRIIKAYEITNVSKVDVDKYLKEGVQYNGLKGFKQHLKEQVVEQNGNVTSFIFRDGMIPIVDEETSAVTYVDFEEALSKNLINPDMFDVSSQGPVIVFRYTDEQVTFDERFADHMGGDELQTYIALYRRNMYEMV